MPLGSEPEAHPSGCWHRGKLTRPREEAAVKKKQRQRMYCNTKAVITTKMTFRGDIWTVRNVFAFLIPVRDLNDLQWAHCSETYWQYNCNHLSKGGDGKLWPLMDDRVWSAEKGEGAEYRGRGGGGLRKYWSPSRVGTQASAQIAAVSDRNYFLQELVYFFCLHCECVFLFTIALFFWDYCLGTTQGFCRRTWWSKFT